MNVRTIIIGAVAVILTGGALLSSVDDPRPCTVTSHGISSGRIIGTASCETGTVLLIHDGVPMEADVRRGMFSAALDG